MNDEQEVEHDDAQITGRTEGPYGSDDTDVDHQQQDNRNTYEQENSANGLDSQQVRGGQDGRNIRAMGGIDMDSQNGVLRMGDMDNSTMEVTQEGAEAAVSGTKSTNTAMVNVTTSGPDDYSANKAPVPDAQKAAKKQNDDQSDDAEDKEQQEREDEVAETGTDLTNQPTY